MHPETAFILLDIAVSFVSAILFWLILPKAWREPKWWILLLFFIFGFYVPILGVVAIGVMVLLLRFAKFKAKERKISVIEMPFFMRQKVEKPITFGESGAWTRTRTKTVRSEDRMQSIFAMNVFITPSFNLFLLIMFLFDTSMLLLYVFILFFHQHISLP